MGREGDEASLYIKKGPWTAEEDEVLINHVKKYGPRDWSSIRSMKLLPRTGKSCRLRWVNKLRPNLKSGCKFSAEEERLVIELQGEIGNKWAKIATYLPGRTDNDVKNFWSTRRKRLERMLKTTTTTMQKQQKNNDKGKNHIYYDLPVTAQVPFGDTCFSSSSYNMGNTEEEEEFNMVQLQDLVKPDLLNSETETIPDDIIPSTDHHSMISSYPSFPQFDPYQLGFPVWSENYQELASDEPIDSMVSDIFGLQECAKTETDMKLLSTELPPFGTECKADTMSKNGDNENSATFDSLFDEFPSDMFEY